MVLAVLSEQSLLEMGVKMSKLHERALASWLAGVPLSEFITLTKPMRVEELQEVTYIYSMAESCLRVWCRKAKVSEKGEFSV